MRTLYDIYGGALVTNYIVNNFSPLQYLCKKVVRNRCLTAPIYTPVEFKLSFTKKLKVVSRNRSPKTALLLKFPC